MSTPQIWKTFDKYADFFQGRSYYKMALEWDTKSQKVKFVKNQKQLLIWYFNILVPVCLLSMGSSVFVIMRKLFNNNHPVSLFLILIYGVLIVFNLLAVCIALGLAVSGDAAVVAWNNLLAIEADIRVDKNDKAKKPNSKNRKTQQPTDWVGLGLYCSMYFAAAYPYLVTAITIPANIDPYNQVVKDIVPLAFRNRIEIKWCLILFRAYVCFITTYEFFRVVTFLLIMAVAVLRISSGILAMAEKEKQVTKLLKFSHESRIMLNLGANLVQHGSAILMFVGFLLCVASSYTLVTLYGLIPDVLYWVSFSAAVFFYLIIHHTLPAAIEIHEITSKILIKQKGVVHRSWNSKYYRRCIRAQRPASIEAGILGFRLFILKRSTKSTFYDAILMYTINSVLSIPGSLFYGFGDN